MKLQSMNISAGEEKIRTTINLSRFGKHWRVFMHPVVAIDGGWFLPESNGFELRQIWLHGGSIKSLLPKVIHHSVWDAWHDLEGVVSAIPSMVINNRQTGNAIMVNSVDDTGSSIDQCKKLMAACNSMAKEMPSLMFTESQLLNDTDEVMMYLCRAFLEPGQSHLAVVHGDHKLVVA